MADDQDKSQQTEEPTPKRLDRRANTATSSKSTEVTTFIVLAGGTLAIAMFGQSAAREPRRAPSSLFLEQPDQMQVDGAGLVAMMRVFCCRSSP